ncbi:peptide-modifying radical SAM enzyme CbpB [Desulfoferrobacter suflitae]|uniref:peptide-modifying radical SAM enzyme CbpB n=1 Tax=Desulfoferrobacter suflitae TaxID=2865782 RepID=UPI002164C17A|nr:peptide-modifying radical SAM enzyme CbpB [Desulfoferrobacter suflitae]MCK8603192.1 peptide-modifying radical SAM enzyme CbpB [Desulfoferrobacter suflitae]
MITAQSIKEAPRYANTGYGPQFAVLELGLTDRVAVVEPDSAFWALVARDALEDVLAGRLVTDFHERQEDFRVEMQQLRFGLKPSAVYFNPTERCNFNCSYCYLPETMRLSGKSMSKAELHEALERLKDYFGAILPDHVRPQLIFHGSEPMLAKDAVFAGIERFRDDFAFGIQTNASLLDDEAIAFLTDQRVGIGVSLDAPTAQLANLTRKTWQGAGAFERVMKVIENLSGYPAFNVITTVTESNVRTISTMVDFYHEHGVGTVMFNPVRCTQPGGHRLKPANDVLAEYFCKALDRTGELYQRTGRKLVVANFANVLAGIVGPTTRRLMCDLSPCGGGRCFFAVSAHGDVFPCSEFIGFDAFNGGNLYRDDLSAILASEPFQSVTNRKVESIVPCSGCAIRHYCGAPCPAEVKAVAGTLNAPSPYCEFYEEQVRYAFRVIAAGAEQAYLWDGWQEESEPSFCWI